jgi:hypothetical protein
MAANLWRVDSIYYQYTTLPLTASLCAASFAGDGTVADNSPNCLPKEIFPRKKEQFL